MSNEPTNPVKNPATFGQPNGTPLHGTGGGFPVKEIPAAPKLVEETGGFPSTQLETTKVQTPAGEPK